jgi:hypothetical protein
MPELRPAPPGYAWDPRLGSTGRYRIVTPSGALGRIVSNAQIASHLRDLATASEAHLRNIGALMAEGRISAATFQLAMQSSIKHMHTANTALAYGGWDRVPASAWGRAGQQLRQEYQALARFANEINRGEMAGNAIRDRAALYADNAYGRYYDEQGRVARSRGYNLVRIVTAGDERVCAVCRSAEYAGMVPVGTYSIPLHPRCRCEQLFQNDIA